MGSPKKNFYLAVWSAENGISDQDASRHYLAFSADDVVGKFDGAVYRFYCAITGYYPEIEMMMDEELDSSPWACGLEFSGDHVIMGLLTDWCAEVFPLILKLAEANGLVCFDPQNFKVYLPTGLDEAKGYSHRGSDRGRRFVIGAAVA